MASLNPPTPGTKPIKNSTSTDLPSPPPSPASNPLLNGATDSNVFVPPSKLPTRVPTLEPETPPTRYIQSFFILSSCVATLAYAAYFFGFDIFQTSAQQYGILAAVTASLFYTGLVWIDWWEVVVGWWWVSLPLLAGAGFVIVRLDEDSKGLDEDQ